MIWNENDIKDVKKNLDDIEYEIKALLLDLRSFSVDKEILRFATDRTNKVFESIDTIRRKK